jgi:hypothetical protein
MLQRKGGKERGKKERREGTEDLRGIAQEVAW